MNQFAGSLFLGIILCPLLGHAAPGQFAGSGICRSCHQPQFSSHGNTPHAHSLARSSQHRLRTAFPPDAGEWAFGAGDQGVTFVDQVDDDHYVERGLSYYSATKSMSLTPGHRSRAGERYRTFDPASGILRCFQCHSTGPLRLAANFRIEPFEAGVQCEACHGPGAEHAKSRAPIRNPRRLSATELNQFCGACHRMPPPAGVETDWNNPWNVRHQPPYLSQSACFAKSSGKLSCLTCHPPHTSVSRVAADYDPICTTCHARTKHSTNVANRSCIECHMPGVEPQPNLRFTNHWIGIYAKGKPLRPIDSP
jgi:predicted CXXCH cytochrome family protein